MKMETVCAASVDGIVSGRVEATMSWVTWTTSRRWDA